MKCFGFPVDFINMIKCMYFKTTCQANINGHLTKDINVKRGVKQGCPPSSALYVIAISPLLKRIKQDRSLEGVKLSEYGEKVIISAYADDVTVFVKAQAELDTVKEHLRTYELVSGAKLNQDKSEAVWIGKVENEPPLDITVKDQIKVELTSSPAMCYVSLPCIKLRINPPPKKRSII